MNKTFPVDLALIKLVRYCPSCRTISLPPPDLKVCMNCERIEELHAKLAKALDNQR